MQAPEELEPTTKSWLAMRAGEMARRREAMRRAIFVVWLAGWLVLSKIIFRVC
jgi:hypothetical protein